MKSLGADLSDSDLQDLERRFAASSASVKGDSTMFNSRCGENNRGVRYVELLRWGTPRGGGGAHNDSDEVCVNVNGVLKTSGFDNVQ